MGLDTSHDCWHGPYSSFMRWRQELHYWITCYIKKSPDPKGKTREALEEAWERGDYNDQSVPLNVLMGHSDCEGEIAAEVCGPLADALEELLDLVPRRAMYDEARPATERFIAGLRKAAAAGEAVEFR